MKKVILVFVLILLSFPVYAKDIKLPDSFPDTAQGFSFSDAADSMLEGKQVFTVSEMWEKIYDTAITEVRANIGAASLVFTLSLLLSLLSTAQAGFKSDANAAFLAVYMIIAGVLTSAFGEISKLGVSLIENTALFSNTIIPILGTAIIGSAGAGAFSALAPQILAFSNLSCNLIKNIGLPAVYFSFALGLIGNISPNFSLAPLSKVIRGAALWVVSGAVTLFSTVVSISGMSAGSLSGAALRGAKFAASSMIPVLGSILSDSIEAVAGGAALLKNAIGAAGILFIIISVLYPIIKIAAVILIYKVTAAILSSFSDKRITALLNDATGVLSCITGFIITCAVSVIISVSVLLSATNIGGLAK